MKDKNSPQLILDTWPFQGSFPQAKIYHNALSPDLFQLFKTWSLHIHPTPENRTVWCPLSRKPRYLPEQVIHSLYRLIRKSGLPKYQGAEWWTGYRKPHESLHYHVDRDESLFKEQKITVPPLLSTVFYITASGGPTFIPNDFIHRATGKISRAPVTSSLKVFPKPNKFLIFNGNLFHSVLPGKTADEQLRITLIVNFWNQRPHKPVCIDPDPSFIIDSLKENNYGECLSK